ncbi:sensor histidine kinase [Algoriphagus sp.]|jgi:LytS/YehU family sensor histidine kinase|uniref:sensor histidine kinase n=1 Tax=Algoriphagus sp. TaxID=1872435 RepID=UPI0027171CE9|nr:histidine kinase [Algoriphagus sp.]MDO8966934.1 histidine kinase [Algoriphagus sp.]MDP3199742.1 histidine kinase [Algoriphagus sp.]
MYLNSLILFQFNRVLAFASATDSNGDTIQMAILLGLIPVVLAFSFIIFVIYRSRRESDFRKRETELRLSKAEGELKALRAQINPHFIFNCLNSIHHFIQSHEPNQAGDYLIKFSQLIRYVLESSAKQWVSLQEELEANRIYLDLEKLRTGNAFTYGFTLSEELQAEEISIPPMMIQPFLENAVWHGLKESGVIEVLFSMENENHLRIRIKDNGNGHSEKSDIDLSRIVKKSSMGLNLMEDRFRTLNELRGSKAGFYFSEHTSEGKEVIVIIPFDKD